MIKRAKVNYDGLEWDPLSRGCKGFVKALLNPDPQWRMSAAESLAHPWLVKITETKNNYVATDVWEIAD